MYIISSLILTLSIISGQLIKLPLPSQGGITAIDATVIALSILGLFKLKFKLKKPPIFLNAAFVFILIALLSLISTPLKLQTSELITSFMYTARFTSYFIFSWVIISGAFPSIRNKVSEIFIFSGFTLAVLGLIQLIFLPDIRFLQSAGWDPHYFRTVSTFLDPNFLGGFFALTLILLTKKVSKSFFTILMFTIIYIALLTTFSRGAYLAFAIGFILLSIFNRSFKFMVLAAVLAFGLFYGYKNYQRSVAFPRNIDRVKSAESRLNTWQQGLTLFQKAPILGVGYNSYRYALKQYNLGKEDFINTHGATTNDSSLLFVASTTGIIGLSVYLFFLLSIAITAWKNYLQKNPWGIICISVLGAILAQSFFANTLFYPFILIWIILITAKLSA